MTQPVAKTHARPSAWAWALFLASSAFALAAAALLGFTPFG
jgi:hypothetical protein